MVKRKRDIKQIKKQDHLPIRVMPEQNLIAAQIFCQNLRERLKNGEEYLYDQRRKFFIDPVSGIYIPALNRNAINTEWFISTPLTQYAEKIGLPLSLYLINGNHFTLLLKGPHKGTDGKFRITIYDLMHNQEEERIIPTTTENFSVFKEKFIREQLTYDPQRKVYIHKTLGHITQEQYID